MLIQNINRPSTAAIIKRPDIASSKSVRKTNCLKTKFQITKFYCMKTISQLIKQKEKSTLTSIHKSHQNLSSHQSSIHNYRSPQSRLYVSQKKIVDKKDNFNSNSNKFYQNFKKNLIQRNPNLKAKVRHSLFVQNKDRNKICQFINQNIKLQSFASNEDNFLPYNYQKNITIHPYQQKSKCEQWISNHKKKQTQINLNSKRRTNLKRKSQKISGQFLQKQNNFQNSFNQNKRSNQNTEKSKKLPKKCFFSSIFQKNQQKQSSQIYQKRNLTLTQNNSYKNSEPFQVFIIDEWRDPDQLSLSRLMA